MPDYDVAIIGGGPSGATTALYLREHGFTVCLIEKKVFPRETLCGEFLSLEVMRNLKRLRLEESFLDLGPNPIDSFRLVAGDGSSVISQLNFPAYGMMRGRFDEFLLREAAGKGAAVWQPYEATSICVKDASCRVAVAHGSVRKEISATHVVCAYGRRNILDKKLGRAFASVPSRMMGIKFHVHRTFLNQIDRNTISIFSAPDVYCGINVVDSDMVTVCFLARCRANGPAPRDLLKNLFLHPHGMKTVFPEGFENELSQLPVHGVGNIFFGRKELVKDGVFMVGDAAGIIAPLAGDGIGMAMEGGKLIAEAFDRQREKNLSTRKVEALYAERWNALFARRILIARFAQKILLSSILRPSAVRSLQLFPGLLSYIIEGTRG